MLNVWIFLWNKKSVICWSKWSKKLIPKYNDLSNSHNFEYFLHSFIQAIDRFAGYSYRFHCCFVSLVALCQFYYKVSGNENKLKNKTNANKMIWAMQLIEQMLLLPRILQITIQVIKKYKASDFQFLNQLSHMDL